MPLKKIVATLRYPLDRRTVTKESRTLVELLNDKNKGGDIVSTLYFTYLTNLYEEPWFLFRPKEKTYELCFGRGRSSPQTAYGLIQHSRLNEVFFGVNSNEDDKKKSLADIKRQLEIYAKRTENPGIVEEYERLVEQYKSGASNGFGIIQLYLSTLKSTVTLPPLEKGVGVHCHPDFSPRFSPQDRLVSLDRSLGLFIFGENVVDSEGGESLEVTGEIHYRRGFVEVDSTELGDFKLYFYRPKGKLPQHGYYQTPEGSKIEFVKDFGVSYSTKKDGLFSVLSYPNVRFMARFPIGGEIDPDHPLRNMLLNVEKKFYPP